MNDAVISADFSYTSHFVDVLGSKIHYVEEGMGEPILFLHGNPTSAYLWRNILPYLAPLGRAIAMDLIGMGQSDKPDIDYRFSDHARYVDCFIEQLGLENLTLVVHDWGSALGFHYAMRHEKNVKGIAFMEAILMAVPSWEVFPEDFRAIFKSFRTPVVGWDLIVKRNIFIERVLPGGIRRKLTEEEMNHYRQPFKDPKSRKPIWRWPNEIPIAGKPADVVEAVSSYNQRLQQSDVPKLLFYATPGAILRSPAVSWCRGHLKNLEMVDLGPGHHFLQEDHPHQIGSRLAEWYPRL